MGFQIEQASEPAQIDLLRELFREYQQSANADVCFTTFDRELAALPGEYAAPAGRLWIVKVEGEPAGCVALRPLKEGYCEMKRLYVRSGFRGTGLSRQIVDALLNEAREGGYQGMRLDTLPHMKAAIALYRGLGFSEVPRYNDNPEPSAIFFEKAL